MPVPENEEEHIIQTGTHVSGSTLNGNTYSSTVHIFAY